MDQQDQQRTEIESGLTIEGVFYPQSDLQGAGAARSKLYQHYVQVYGVESFHVSLAEFLEEWFNESATLIVKTSGSTGKPKLVEVEKERMRNSARLTVSFLGLKTGDSAHLCMPLQYIAGKMVVIRALVAHLNLIPVAPSAHPLASVDQSPVFSAMIPLQVSTSLLGEQVNAQGQQVEGEQAVHEGLEAQRLRGIEHLIIGGGAVDSHLGQLLQDFPHQVWSTYGMTETLSHIALRRLNGSAASEWYTPFPTVELSLSEEDTLVIFAPLVNPDRLVTNDRVEFNAQGQFRILGRKDNVINSGGVKLQIEEIEQSLLPHLACPAVISAQTDARFGERVVLLLARHKSAYGTAETESQQQQSQDGGAGAASEGLTQVRDLSEYLCLHGDQQRSAAQNQALQEIAAQEQIDFFAIEQALHRLPKYWQPKRVYLCDTLPQTATGKPQRARTKQLLAQL